MTKYTKESIMAVVEEFYQKNGRPPRVDEMNSRHGLPAIATFTRLTGTSPTQYLRKKHPKKPKSRKSRGNSSARKDEAAIVLEYRRFFEEHNRMPTPKDCKEKRLAYPATFKRVTGSSPWAYFRQEQIATSKQKNDEAPQEEPVSSENEPFILELLKRLGVSWNDVALRTGLSAQQIRALLSQKPSEEFLQIYAIAKALNVPMEVLYRGKNHFNS